MGQQEKTNFHGLAFLCEAIGCIFVMCEGCFVKKYVGPWFPGN